MEFLSKYRKGFKRLFIVISMGYFTAFLTIYFYEYREPDCSGVMSKDEYQHSKKMLDYEPTKGELKQYQLYKEEVDRIYEEYMKEHRLEDWRDRFLIDENELNLPKDPSAGKGYFIEKGTALDSYIRSPLRTYEKCNEAWYWKYLKPLAIALIIYIAILATLWVIYNIVIWVIKGFKENT